MPWFYGQSFSGRWEPSQVINSGPSLLKEKIVSFSMTGNCGQLLQEIGMQVHLSPQSSKKLSAVTCGCTEVECGMRFPHQWNSADSDDKLCRTPVSVILWDRCFSVGKQSQCAVKALVWVLISSHRKTKKGKWLADCHFTEDFKLREIEGKKRDTLNF